MEGYEGEGEVTKGNAVGGRHTGITGGGGGRAVSGERSELMLDNSFITCTGIKIAGIKSAGIQASSLHPHLLSVIGELFGLDSLRTLFKALPSAALITAVDTRRVAVGDKVQE